MTHRRTRMLRPRRAPTKGSMVIVALAFTLGACSFLPDFANPAAIFGGDSSARESDAYPRLSTVPARPQTATATERREAADGLISDRENARYLDEDVRVAADEPALPAVPRGAVQVTSSNQRQGRATPRRRDPAAPVPVQPQRRPTPRPVVAEAQPVREPVQRPAIAPSEERLATTRDSVDSRRLITTGRVGGPLQQRALIPRQRSAVPSSIVRRDDESLAPRKVPRPASASVTQPQQVARLEEGPSQPAPRQPAPVRQQPAQTPPRLNAAPVAVAQAAPRGRPAGQRRTESPVALGENTLAKVYLDMLAASASTVTTAPANPAFKPTTALPLPQQTLGVSPIVRESYNAAVEAASSPPRAQLPGTRVVESRPRTTVGSRTQVAALVPLSPVRFPARRGVAPQRSAVAPGPLVVIKFANGSSRVSARNRRQMRDIVARAREQGGFVRVVGHSSSRTKNLPLAEHNLVNFSVSLDRAQSVANELMRQGVPPARIIVEAKGDTDPVFFETMPEGEAENRRVEIFLDF